jgi:hypothetical protein
LGVLFVLQIEVALEELIPSLAERETLCPFSEQLPEAEKLISAESVL